MSDSNTNKAFVKRIGLFEPFVIFTFWIVLFASPLLFGQFEDEINWIHVFDIWKNHVALLALFLVHRFVLMPLFFFKGKKVLYFSLIFVLILAGTMLTYLFNNTVIPQRLPPPHERIDRPMENLPEANFGRELPPPNHPVRNNQGPIPAYANFLMLSILLLGFDAGLQISMRWANLEQEKFRLQKENVENQLAFLRNQISPHFFMNTLNNIHALVDIDSEEAKESIIKLSNLMRHLLYDCEEKSTPIIKEVGFIRSYIELMRLRFSDKVVIEVDIPNVIPDKSIPPLLFTSLLENAFKHGISYNKDSFIHITMSFTDDQLNFRIENSNHSKKAEEPSGIGIENIKKRLDLIYNKTYSLDIVDVGGKYSVTLNIPL
ncbi:histidine kinase [Maribacter sp. ANRC-HE7]|uniref:Histidine kinase n=1 Tax=Maribacter aquimaris TaxID=2737171 RepID=A0ABR7V1U1_9FLAO|nr:histidine kinase [Maribacter aquimaris]MBD0777889.1 histidine kinase [Maribacter aquimaris]